MKPESHEAARLRSQKDAIDTSLGTLCQARRLNPADWSKAQRWQICIRMRDHEGAHQWAPDSAYGTEGDPTLGDPSGIVAERFRSTSRPKIDHKAG